MHIFISLINNNDQTFSQKKGNELQHGYNFLEPNPTVLLSKLNDTAVSINVALVGGNFDDATVTFVPSDVGPITFSKSQLPYVAEGLTPLTNYTLTIVFSVGAITNCGTNGPVSANPGDIVYQPGNYFRLICSQLNSIGIYSVPPPPPPPQLSEHKFFMTPRRTCHFLK